jgi:hypothetical protein
MWLSREATQEEFFASIRSLIRDDETVGTNGCELVDAGALTHGQVTVTIRKLS